MPTLRSTELRNLSPGTSFISHRLSPNRSGGKITAFFKDVATAADLALLAGSTTAFPSVYPGDVAQTPLRYVSARLLENGNAVLVAHYGVGGSNRFNRELSISPARRSSQTYVYHADQTEDERPKDAEGFYKPRIITVPQVVVTWSDVVFSDSMPSLSNGLVGRINNDGFSVKGVSIAAGSARFEGDALVYENWGAYDRFYLRKQITVDSQSWMTGALDRGAAPGTPVARQLYDASLYTGFGF